MPSKWPTTFQYFRQAVGRALRESGQALDRAGIKMTAIATSRFEYYDDIVIFEDFLSRHTNQYPLLHAGKPIVHPEVAYIAPCSTLLGSVRIGKNSSVWYGAVLRADMCLNADSYYNNKSVEEELREWELSPERFDNNVRTGGAIFIGDDTNIQDNCIVTSREQHTVIGKGVTVGHLAQIHSATIKDYCLIGMGSIIKEGVVIEEESFVGAGAVVEKGQVIGSGELWVGNPARKIRDLNEQQRGKLHYQSSEYVGVALGQREVMQFGANSKGSWLLPVNIFDEDEIEEIEREKLEAGSNEGSEEQQAKDGDAKEKDHMTA